MKKANRLQSIENQFNCCSVVGHFRVVLIWPAFGEGKFGLTANGFFGSAKLGAGIRRYSVKVLGGETC